MGTVSETIRGVLQKSKRITREMNFHEEIIAHRTIPC